MLWFYTNILKKVELNYYRNASALVSISRKMIPLQFYFLKCRIGKNINISVSNLILKGYVPVNGITKCGIMPQPVLCGFSLAHRSIMAQKLITERRKLSVAHNGRYYKWRLSLLFCFAERRILKKHNYFRKSWIN